MTFLRTLKGAAALCSLLAPFPLDALTPSTRHQLVKGQLQCSWTCSMDSKGAHPRGVHGSLGY